MTDKTTTARRELEALYELLEAKEQHLLYNKCEQYMPDSGELCRAKYPKHLAFFAAGKTFLERVAFGANRAGKSELGAHEVYYHASGNYPHWWEGKRFNHSITIWACGVDNLTVRDVLQFKLLGRRGDEGTGIIPRSVLEKGSFTTKAGVPGAVQDIFIPHANGGVSQIIFKSYEQEMKAFMGSAVDVVWLDEEPPRDIYDECLMRIASTKGIIFCTFTPLQGFSDVVKEFLPNQVFPEDHIVRNGTKASKWVIRIEWDDAPHLDEATKEQLKASLLPHMREARTKGIPCVGVGKVYPVPEDDFIIPPFNPPVYFERVYGMDVGWRNTAAIFGAYDRRNDILYIYDEYCVEEQKAPLIASSIRRKGGDWMIGVVDPSANKRNPNDGVRLLQEYCEEGLQLYKADNTLRAGITAVYSRLVSGRLKIMHNCQRLIGELRGYAYDELGNIKGKSHGRAQDHACDALRYLIMSGLDYAQLPPDNDPYDDQFSSSRRGNSITGY